MNAESIGIAVQMRGPDAMHTLAGEVKGCFAMLAGDPYTSTNTTAQAIRSFEEQTNQRFTLDQVCV